VRGAVEAGADEVDIVLEPGWSADKAREHMAAIRAVTPEHVVLKVILETSLRTEQDLREVAKIAMEEGADFIKSSTGRRGNVDTHAVTVMASEVKEFQHASSRLVGLKISGGVRTPADAVTLLSLAMKTCPALTLKPKHLRIGASSLLDALVPTGTSVSAAGTSAGVVSAY
jgi:deoxyribose-phosphate aldolase